MRILDRYVLREVTLPFLLALLLLTFALMIPPVINQGEELIGRGASWMIVVRVLATLLPQSLGITIPMALLVGTLIALGRLSGDREVVALEACGVSLLRLLRPLLVLAVAATAATAYVMIVALPAANQSFREIMFKLLMTQSESQVKARVFYTGLPNKVIYAREITPGVGWSDVVVADNASPDDLRLYLAKRGRVFLDEAKRTVQVILEDGTTHRVAAREPEKYQLIKFDQTVLNVDPDSVFPRQGPSKGLPEMTVAELRAVMAERRAQMVYPHNEIMAWQKKYSIPSACLAFILVALGLGVSNRRDGRLASFVLGVAVVFVYWMLLLVAEAATKAAIFPGWFAWLSMWIPNIVVAIWGALIIVKKARAPERPIRFPLPGRWRRSGRQLPESTPSAGPVSDALATGLPEELPVSVPRFTFPRPSILDWYVLKQSLWISTLSTATLLGLFYIATFIDLSDHLFRGRATGATLARYLWYATPQFTYYIVPLAVLMGALVTIGALTKNSELVVMKACGISLYRAAAPLIVLAVLGSAILLGLEERVLAYSNRRADLINDAIRGRLPKASGLDRRWVAASNGNLYQYVYFDSDQKLLMGLSIYEFGQDPSTLARRTYLSNARFDGDRETKGIVQWQGDSGWQRRFIPTMTYAPVTKLAVTMEGPGYFGSERPDAEQMSYGQLRDHIVALKSGGFSVVAYDVALHRKLAFPFVTLIMTLIAVPFAVTTGKRGALYGIGAGIVLAILYWIAISVSGAIGGAGLLEPALAAWAPNVIFGCCALYLLLTVRT